MRLVEIVPPATHPHLVTVQVSPSDLPRLRRYAAASGNRLRIMHVDRTATEVWPVTFACASAPTGSAPIRA